MPATTTTVADRYRLLEELGRGGMGVVWRGHDELLHRDVAVKEMHLPPGVADDARERLVARALREARAVARIDSSAVVSVFDVVEQDGRPWIVMELLRGESLSSVLARGPLPPEEAARVGLGILDGLDVAHTAGVLHRDIKPSNVIVGPDGRVVLTDFGVATLDSDPGDTTTGVVVGSPSYVAPERAHGHKPTPASDLWGLGATLYAAVEGRPPYDGDTAMSILHAITTQQAPRCSQCAGPLADLVERLLDRDPARRPTPGEARAALTAAAADSAASGRTMAATAPLTAASPYEPGTADRTTVVAPAADPIATPEAAPTGAPPAATSAPGSTGRRRRWPLLVALALAVATVAVVLIAFGSNDGSPSAHGSHHTGRPASGSGGGATGSTGVPSGWDAYTDPTLGWSIGVPPGWQVTGVGDGGARITDPAGGRYLQVATRYPAGSSAVGAWRDQERAFAGSHSGYQQLRLASITPPAGASDAADWEFLYTQDGAALHALDRAIVVNGRGYALYFQTHADAWDGSASLWDGFSTSFAPAG
jgi:serine/threonine protein kinase